MMRINRLLVFLFVLSFSGISVSGRDFRDTLYTRMGDRIVVSYELNVSDDCMTVRFRPPIIFLGNENERTYKKREQLTLVFFDRNGNYQDASFQGEVMTESFMVPANAGYSSSSDGYFLLHDNPSLVFRIKNPVEPVSMAIPFYLAYHVKRGKYKIIARCDDLSLKYAPVSTTRVSGAGSRVETMTQSVEIESDNRDMTKVLDCIANIRDRLPLEDRLPFSESLEGDIRLLREWQYNVDDRNLKRRVTETLNEYDSRKRELEDQAAAVARKEQERQVEEQRRAHEELMAQNDAAAAAQKQEAEKQSKRRTWMIVIGAIVAIGTYTGNQFLQHFRAAKNQKSMMQMQQSMVRQAENAARRKVQSSTRQVVRQVTQKPSTTLKTVSKNSKKKKHFSI